MPVGPVPARRSRCIRLAAVAATLLLIAAACGDDESGDGGGASAESAPIDFSERGPYEVGTTTLELDDTLVEIFYPAADDADGEKLSYTTQEPLGEDLQALIPEDLNTPIEIDAIVDAEASTDGPFPLVLHSHGFGSFRRFAANHLAHLASWGLVGAAPDHLERGLAAQTTGGGGAPADPDADVATLASLIDLLTQFTTEQGDPLEGVIDTEQVGVEGHSAGGGAALEFGTDPQVDVVIGQAPASPVPFDQRDEDADMADQLAEVEAPDKPVMIIAADGDVAIDLESEIDPLYDWLVGPKQLSVLEQTGHSVFIDNCQEFWEQGGLIDLVSEIGLPIDEGLLELGNDGCDPDDDVEPTTLWPVVDHLSVAWYRTVFGPDAESAELSLGLEFLDEQFGDRLEELRSE